MKGKLTERQEQERLYHDSLYKQNAFDDIYRGAEGAYKCYWEQVQDVKGLRILDFGCGNGWLSIVLAKQGATVWGIDISSELINEAKRWGKNEGLEYKTHFLEMAGEDLSFEDNFFDLIIGSAVLHHTDLEATLEKIHKVLKYNGRALFIEPMNQNIFLRIWRRITPSRRSPYEKALAAEDLKMIKKKFPETRLIFWNLFSIITEGLLIFSPRNRFLILANKVLEKVDNAILEIFPPLGKYSAVVIIEMKKNDRTQQ